MSFAMRWTKFSGRLGPASLLLSIAVAGYLPAYGQTAGIKPMGVPSGKTLVSRSGELVEMTVNSTHLLSSEEDIERATVHNDSIITVRPMARNELMVSAKATGVTQVDLYSPDKGVRSVQIFVTGDARELEAILRAEFPMASLQVRPIQNAVVVSGQVSSDAHVEQVVAIAEQFYPTVINRIEVIGVHTVTLHAQVMEISRTKLRELGVDWALGFGNDYVAQTVSGTLEPGGKSFAEILNPGQETVKLGIIDNGNSFFAAIRALQQKDLVKVMADPTLVAIDGRPASFNSGGEFPILVPAGLGQVGIDFREYGTRLDFVAKVRGDGRIWLEVRPTISEIDPSRSVTLSGVSVPGLRSRYVDTAVELRAGQTLALAGLIQVRTETQSAGLPGLADIPYLGALFRANREIQNEVELLIMVTPDFAGAMDPCEVPPGGPGFESVWPTDAEFYWRGYIETPTPCPTGGMTSDSMMPSSSSEPMMPGAVSMPMAAGLEAASANQGKGSESVDNAAYRTSSLPVSTITPSGYVAPR
jgi:pilus assembly protein CpaC